MAFNKPVASRAVALDIFKAFDRAWHAGLLDKRKSYRISGQIFGLIFSFLNNTWLSMVLDGKTFQGYSVKRWSFWVVLDGNFFQGYPANFQSFSRLYSWFYTFPAIHY